MVSATESFNIGTQQETLQELLAAKFRKSNQQEHQEGPNLPTYQDGQPVLTRRSNLSETTKRSRIVGDSPERSNNVA